MPTPHADATYAVPNIATLDSRVSGLTATVTGRFAGIDDFGNPRGPSGIALNYNNHWNHDTIFVALQLMLRHPGDPVFPYYLSEFKRVFMYYAAHGSPPFGFSAAYCLSEGFALDYLTNGDAASLNALDLLRQNGSYMSYDSEGYTVSYVGSREAAYAINAQVNSKKCGLAWDRTYLNLMVHRALGHITQWTDLSCAWFDPANPYFIQPFMMAITSASLIRYLEFIEGGGAAAGPDDGLIVAAIAALNDWVWKYAWERTGPTRLELHWWPVGYTDPDPQNDTYKFIYMESAYPFFWLWKRTGDPQWLYRGATIFNVGVSADDGEINYQPKQVNEWVRYAIPAAKIYEDMTGGSPPSPPPPPPPPGTVVRFHFSNVLGQRSQRFKTVG